jgi:hypothetical protein
MAKKPRLDKEPIRETIREPVRARGKKEVVGRDGKVLSRKRGGNVDKFYIPPHIIPDGWSYEWKSEFIAGQENTSHMMGCYENGWTPVNAETHPGMFMPNDYKGPIRREGMILCERPIELTNEARAEEQEAARALTQAQKEQLGLAMPSGFTNEHRAVQPRVNQAYEPADISRPKLQIED